MNTKTETEKRVANTRDEHNLLLFLECRATDYGGAIDMRMMNYQDNEKVEEWRELGFIEYGRICAADNHMRNKKTQPASISAIHQPGSQWCRLSEAAWQEAHRLRRERHEQMWKNRTWKTTEEIKG